MCDKSTVLPDHWIIDGNDGLIMRLYFILVFTLTPMSLLEFTLHIYVWGYSWVEAQVRALFINSTS